MTSSKVDPRVVEMRFDNKQFERGAKETMSTLDKLKAALDMTDSAKTFDLLDKAADNVNLSGIASAVETLQHRFSTFGIIGMRVIENITDALLGKLSSAVNFVSDSIISGGIRRAMNIENAHFQLQALLKDEELVQEYMDAAMKSVDGTAYAYDEAAKAASQFAASGVKAGDEVLTALRGITGVAAMTNSEYEGISRIFTTVAGNGRLMGDQLLQLSTRGMNAAATISNYFKEVKGLANMTEAEVRDMVSDGEISFQIFAEAMDWAFGESAFRANETFTGAFANMKAALARIGAGFFSPIVEQNSEVVKLFNALRVQINQVKSALVFDEQTSAISGLAKASGLAKEELSAMFSEIDENGSLSTDQLKTLTKNGINATISLQQYLNGVISGTQRASYSTTTAVRNLAQEIILADDSIRELVELGDVELDDLISNFQFSQKAIRDFVDNGRIDLSMFTSAMETEFGDQMALSKQFTDYFLDKVQGITEAINKMDLSKPLSVFYYGIESVKNVTSGLYSIIEPVGKAFSEVFLDFSVDDVMNIADKIKKLTEKFRLSEKNAKNLHDTFKGVFDIFKLLRDGSLGFIKAILPIGSSVHSLGDGLLNLSGSIGRTLSKFSEWISNSSKISEVYTIITTSIQTASSWLTNFIDNIDDFIDIVKNFPIIQRLINQVTKSFQTASSWLTNFIDNIDGFIDTVKNFSIVRNIINGLVIAFEGLREILSRIEIRFAPFQSILNLFMSIIKTAGPITINILRGIGNAISFVLKSVSEAVGEGGFNSFLDLLNSGMLVGIVYGISKFIESLTATVNKAGGIFSNVNRNLLILKNTLLTFQAQLKANVLKTIAVSIAILAGSLFVLAMINSDKLASSLGAITVLMTELFGILTGFDKIMKGSKLNVATISTGLIGLSVSIFILSIALKKISQIDSDKIIFSLGTISTLLIEMTAVTIALSKYGGKIKTGALSIIALSAAIYILSSAIKKIGDLDVNVLIKGLISVGALLAELGGFMLIAKFGNFKMSQAIAIVALSAALLILQKAVEGFGNINGEILLKGIIVIGALLAEIGAFTLASGESKHIFKTAVSLIMMAYAFKILEEPMKSFGSMSWEEIGKGLVLIGGALTELTIALKMMPKNVLSIGIGLIAVAGALTIIGNALKNISSMSWEEIGKGLVLIGGALTELTIALKMMPKNVLSIGIGLIAVAGALTIIGNALKNISSMSWEEIGKGMITLAGAMLILAVSMHAMKGTIGASAAMLIMATSLAIFIPVLKSIGNMDIKSIIKSLITLAATFTIIGIAGLLLEPVIPSIFALSGAMLMLGIACAAVGVGVLAFSVGLTTLAASGVAGAAALIEVIRILVLGVLNTIIDSSKSIGEAILVVILTVCDVLVESVPEIVKVILIIIKEVFIALADNMPEITHEFLRLVIGIIDSLADDLPILIQSVLNLFMKFFSGIVEGLKQIDVKVLLEGIIAIGLIGVIMMALSAMVTLAPGAMIGVLAIGGVITELSILLAAIGALAQIPGLKWLIGEGGELLKGVGTAIGEFVGSIIGGALGSMSDSFPIIGANMTSFMENLQGFIEGSRNIDQDAINGVNSIIKMILALTAVSVIDGITTLLTLGQGGFATLGTKLAQFGEGFAGYIEAIGGTDVDMAAVESSARAAEALGRMVSYLPSEGGWIDKIFGTKSLKDFGEQLADFADPLMDFAEKTSGLTPEAVEGAVNATKLLSEMAKTLPNTGGLLADLLGDNRLDEFGEELVSFGPNISLFAEQVKNIKPEMVEGAVNAAQILSDMANTLPNSGGLAALILGDNKLSDFAEELKEFGPKIVRFARQVESIKPEMVTGASDAARIMANMAKILPDTGGLKSVIFGDATLSEFGAELVLFGGHMKQFAEDVKEINVLEIAGVIGASRLLIDMSSNIKESGGLKNLFGPKDDIATFGKNLESFGKSFVNFYDKIKDVDTTTLGEVIFSMHQLINLASKASDTNFEGLTNFGTSLSTMATNGMSQMITAFEDSMVSVTDEIILVCTTIIDTMDENLPESSFKEIGKNVLIYFGKGLNEWKPATLSSVESLCKLIVKKFEDNLAYDTFYSIGSNAGQGLHDGLTDKLNQVALAAQLAAQTIASITRETLDIHSPSRVAFQIGAYWSIGMVNGILSKKRMIKKSSEETSRSVIDATNSIVQAIVKHLDENPDYSPTISPVLDLSNLEQSSQKISSYFKDGFAIRTANQATMTASTIRQGKVAKETREEETVKERKALNNFLMKLKGNETGTKIENTFNIVSNNPDEVAEVVSRKIQRQVERKATVWE